MPRIDAVMAASLRPGGLGQRDITGTVSDVKNSFSSWDNCMNAAYCKWPVIVAIIIGGLILISVITCIVRCACCGMSCCCSCFECLRCCGDCCGCCDPPKGRPPKHLDEPNYPPQQGYTAPPPMMTGAASAYEPPKYAQFETGPTGHALEPKMVSDDALPPMPSWETAQKKRVPTEDDGSAMEMGELDPKTGQQVPLMSGANSISRTGSPSVSPVHSHYGDGPGMNERNGYMGSGALSSGGMGAGRRMGPGAMGQGVLGPEAMAAGALGAGAMAMGGRGHDPYGRNDSYRSNGPNDRNGFNGPNGHSDFISPQSDPYSSSDQAMSYMTGTGRNEGYDNQYLQGQSYPPNDNRPGNYGPGAAAAGGAHGRGQPPRRFSPDSGSRPFPPPQRQYSQDSNRPLMAPSPQRIHYDSSTLIPYDAEPTIPFTDSDRGPPGRMVSPPGKIGSGFDFGDGNASRDQGRGQGAQVMPTSYGGNVRRPSAPSQQQGGSYTGSTASPSYKSRSPPPLQQGGNGGGYPEHQSYSAPERQWPGRTPPSSGGRGREATGWEGV